jgi:hypothetical protein
MMTKAFLAQIAAEDSNQTLLKILNNLPEAVLLLKRGQNTIRHATIESHSKQVENIKNLQDQESYEVLFCNQFVDSIFDLPINKISQVSQGLQVS